MKKQCEVMHDNKQCENEANLLYYHNEKEYHICEKCFSQHNSSNSFTLKLAEFVEK